MDKSAITMTADDDWWLERITMDGEQRYPERISVGSLERPRVYVPERTCRMGAPIDGEYRCGECGHLNRETYRADKGWHPPEYCAHCGARAVEGDA